MLIGREVRIGVGIASWLMTRETARRCQKATKSCQSEHHAILKVIPTDQGKKSCQAKK